MDESDLVRRATAGDDAAVVRLLERHLPALRAYVRRHAGPELAARESRADLVQSVCREVLQDLGAFEYRGEEAFRAWLFQQALRKVTDRHRHWLADKRDVRREAQRGGPGASEWTADDLGRLARTVTTPSRAAVRREDLDRLSRALERLSDEDRALVRAVRLDGRTHAEVAAELGIDEAACRKRLSRALVRLSRHLEG